MAEVPSSQLSQCFANLPNFRDVGGTINALTLTVNLKPGLLYRSARPDEATPQDRELLRSHFNINTIVDLRTDTEHVEQVKKLARRGQTQSIPSAPPIEPKDPQQPLRIPGIQYVNVDLNGSAYSRALIKRLSWSQTATLVGLYALGYRTDAVAVLGTNVMAKRGLIGLAEDSLTHSTAEVKALFDILADSHAYPLLVHCTQGKDRTGLVILLVLLLVDIPFEAIEKDYLMTQRELANERESRVEEIRAIGLPAAFADCPSEWPGAVRNFIDTTYGGVEQYLLRCGVDERKQKTVKRILKARVS